MTKPRIFVAVPSCRDWKAEFGTSMISLTSHLTGKIYKGEIGAFIIRCQLASLLSLGREMLLAQAIEEDYTHILWIDDDTRFPHSVIDTMLSRDVDFLAANMCRKKLPCSPIANGFDFKAIDSRGKTGIEEVWRAGLGLCLMKVSCVKEIPAPRFEVLWLEQAKTYLGEDCYLCEQLKEKGVKLHIDHEVSQLVGHIGDYAYGYPAS